MTARKKLSPKDIQHALRNLPMWRHSKGMLVRSVKPLSYRQGATWLAQIVDLAEKLDHHPDMLLSYGELEIKLSTHDAGGVTQLDCDMAAVIDQITDDEKTIKQDIPPHQHQH